MAFFRVGVWDLVLLVFRDIPAIKPGCLRFNTLALKYFQAHVPHRKDRIPPFVQTTKHNDEKRREEKRRDGGRIRLGIKDQRCIASKE